MVMQFIYNRRSNVSRSTVIQLALLDCNILIVSGAASLSRVSISRVSRKYSVSVNVSLQY